MIIASREIWVTVLRSYAKRQGVVIAAGPLGKAKMAFQVFTLLALIAFDLTGAALALPLYVMVAITDRVRHRDRAACAARADRTGPRPGDLASAALDIPAQDVRPICGESRGQRV